MKVLPCSLALHVLPTMSLGGRGTKGGICEGALPTDDNVNLSQGMGNFTITVWS